MLVVLALLKSLKGSVSTVFIEPRVSLIFVIWDVFIKSYLRGGFWFQKHYAHILCFFYILAKKSTTQNTELTRVIENIRHAGEGPVLAA